MYKILIVLSLLMIPESLIWGQTQFSKVFYHDTYSVRANSIVNTFDNNYFLAGEINSKPLVLKMDMLGNIVWSKTYGSQGIFNKIIRTNDSCFVLTGNIFNVVDSACNVFCVKINASGDTIWTREINLGLNDYVYSIKQTNDKGYILTGATSTDTYNGNYFNDNYLHSQIIIVRLDSAGNLLWGKNIAENNYFNKGLAIVQLPDSNFIATGYVIDSTISQYASRFFIMNIDTAGNVSWFKMDDASIYFRSFSNDVLVNDSILNFYLSTNDQCSILSTDLLGNILWSKQYSVSNYFGFYNQISSRFFLDTNHNLFLTTSQDVIFIDSTGNNAFASSTMNGVLSDCIKTSDNKFMEIFTGPEYITKYSGQPEIGILKTDSLGENYQCMGWNNSITSSIINLNIIPEIFTDNFIGSVIQQNPQIADVSILERNGCVDVVGNVKQMSKSIFKVYPNPSNGLFQILFDENVNTELIKIDIYNEIGQKVYESSEPVTNGQVVNLNTKEEGIYFIQCRYKEEIFSKKIITSKNY
jgi:hypothetical protein